MNKIIPNIRIHHIAVVAEDFEATIAFYEKLGFVKYTGWGEGEKRIQLMDIGNGSHMEIFASNPESTRVGGRFVHLAFAVEDVEQAFKVAIEAGATEKIAPKVVPLESSPKKISINCAFVIGLNGEVIEFFREI